MLYRTRDSLELRPSSGLLKSSLIAIGAVALGGGQLRAVRANFIIEAHSEFNNSGLPTRTVQHYNQTMSKHYKHTIEELIYYMLVCESSLIAIYSEFRDSAKPAIA